MFVYWITQEWIRPTGEKKIVYIDDGRGKCIPVASEIYLKPRIPYTKGQYEDGKTKRICVSSSISGILSALHRSLNIGYKTFIYYADVIPEDILQPTESMVPDAPITGELWITKPFTMTLYQVIQLTKLEEFSVNNYFVGNAEWNPVKFYEN